MPYYDTPSGTKCADCFFEEGITVDRKDCPHNIKESSK